MYKKILCLMLSASVSAGILCGCSLDFIKGEDTSSGESAVSENNSEIESKANQNVDISDDWGDYEFALQGSKLKLPFDFKELENLGWSVDGELGDEDRIVNKGEEKSVVPLRNSDFRGVTVYANLANLGDSECDIEDCRVTSLSFDAMFSEGKLPEVTLSGGITWGSTVEEAVSAYGEPENEPYANEELGYYYYDYANESGSMELIVFEDGGVKGISLYYNAGGDTAESKAESAAVSSENASSKTESRTESKTASQQSGNAKVSDNWQDFQFEFDGHVYTLLFDYKDLVAAGWSFDLADYGHEDGYTLKKGDMLEASIDLEHSTFDSTVYIGIANTGESDCDVTEGKVWSFECDASFAKKDLPSLTLPKGITWGSTLEQVKAAYGEPQEVTDYSGSLGYYVYYYKTEGINCFSMIIYEDGGLQEFAFDVYDESELSVTTNN